MTPDELTEIEKQHYRAASSLWPDSYVCQTCGTQWGKEGCTIRQLLDMLEPLVSALDTLKRELIRKQEISNAMRGALKRQGAELADLYRQVDMLKAALKAIKALVEQKAPPEKNTYNAVYDLAADVFDMVNAAFAGSVETYEQTDFGPSVETWMEWLKKRDDEITRLKAELALQQAAMTTPEGYAGLVNDAVAKELERLKVELARARRDWKANRAVMREHIRRTKTAEAELAHEKQRVDIEREKYNIASGELELLRAELAERRNHDGVVNRQNTELAALRSELAQERDKLRTSEKTIKELREALQPFADAELIRGMDTWKDDDRDRDWPRWINIGHFRNARAIIGEKKDDH